MRTSQKLFLCLGLALLPVCAHAQTIGQALLDSEIPDGRRLGRNVAVLDRPQPDYDAVGVPVGAFLVFPRLEVGPGYDSNVLGVESNKTSDVYAGLSPNVFVTSAWSRHQVSASAGADLREYASQTSENEEAWHVQLDGRLDVVDQDTITGGFEARKLYDERNSGFYPVGAAAPLGYSKTGGYLRYTKEDGRVRAVVSADSFVYRYDSVPALSGGRIDQSFNNQTTSRFSVRGEYGLTPDTALFAQYSHVIKDYEASGSLDLSSTEERGVSGFTADVSALVRASIGVGYIARSYNQPGFQAVSGLAANGLVQYFPTQLTTISASVRRTVEDSVDFNVSGFFDNQVRLRVVHELLRNVILSTYVNYENDDYRGISRNDNIATAGASALYRFSRNVGVNADLSYTNRTTTDRAAGPVFDETRFLVTVSFHI